MKKYSTVIFLAFLCLGKVYAQSVKIWGEVGLSGNIDQPVTSITARVNHNLVLKQDSTVVAWGNDQWGQTNVPYGLKKVVAISTGEQHSLALKKDGSVVAWGGNDHNQISVPLGLVGVKAIAAGGFHNLALKQDGTVIAWGKNDFGQTTVPSGLNNVVAISAGQSHSVALLQDGSVIAWGADQTNTPLISSGGIAIATGYSHTVVLKQDGTVEAWGSNSEGQSTVPNGLTGVKSITAGQFFTIALKNDGTLVAWGYNYWGQITIPIGLTGVKSIAAGNSHTLVLKQDGKLVAWGYNSSGQTSIPKDLHNMNSVSWNGMKLMVLKKDGQVNEWGNIKLSQKIPEHLNGGIKAIASGPNHSLALKQNGTVVAWGYNSRGQISVPSNLTGVKAIATGSFHSVALKKDGTVVVWGRDSLDFTYQMPNNLTNVVAISAGQSHIIALKQDGTVVTWGGSDFYHITGLSGVKAISSGPMHSLALKNDGTVVAWGLDHAGQSTVPVGLKNVQAISAGLYHSQALLKNGSIVSWGGMDYGQNFVPLDLPGINSIGSGGNSSLAVFGMPISKRYFSGKTFTDSISNCQYDISEKPLSRFTIRATSNTDTLYSGTDGYGQYYFDNLDSGKTYKLTSLTSNVFKDYGISSATTCDTTFTLNVGKNDSTGFDIGYKVKYCPKLKVSIQSTRRRRCFRNQTIITYTNDGYADAKNAIIKVAYPKYVRAIQSSYPWSTKNDSLLTFLIPSVKALETQTITITDSVVCGNESIRGLTQCTKAWFTKANPCKDTLNSWDKSFLTLNGHCFDNGNFKFTAKNEGKGNMTDSSEFKLYSGTALVYKGKMKLTAGQSSDVLLPQSSDFARMELAQSKDFPGLSKPALNLISCFSEGNAVNVSNKDINTFPIDDEDSEIAIDCQPIRDSYDPNDKQVVPTGWGSNAYTPLNARLMYTVRFQNSGTDTAYKVVVVDTLDKDLDIASLEIEGASHNYLYRLSGKNQSILTFTFYNINLPDSTTDKVGSNGFIKYSIKAKKGIPKGTKINNRAAIYFDFNSPILTNITANEMRDTVHIDNTIIKGVVKTAGGLQLLSTPTALEELNELKSSLKVYPNPAQNTINISSKLKDNTYQISDLSGKTMQAGLLETEGNGTIDVSSLQRGVYLLKVGVNWVRLVLL